MTTRSYRTLLRDLLHKMVLSCLILVGMTRLAACGRAIVSTIDQGEITPTVQPSTTRAIKDMPPSLATLASQSQQMRFEHLPPEKGLSQSVVTDLLQDDQGFLWLATQEGLNRYDGNTFRIFKEDPGTPNSLKGNFVASIDKGPEGDIWIGTADGGLNRYDPQLGQFSSFVHDPNLSNSLSESSISSVDVDAQGFVWAGTNNKGLNRLDPASGQVTRYLNDLQNPDSLNSNTITSILADPNGGVWVGTLGGGLNLLDPQTGIFTHFQNDPLDSQSISSNDIQTLYIDHQRVLWVGTFTGGLNRFDSLNGKFTRYINSENDPSSLSNDSVASIYEDSTGQFWVGTQVGGLNLLDRQSGKFTHFQNDPNNLTTLGNNSIISIFEDRSGILWFGTFGSGADYYDPYKNKFLLIRSDPTNPNSLSSNSLWTIYEDDQGILWVATNGAGLNRFDPQIGQWKHYLNDPANPDSLGNNTVYIINQDQQGTFWLGTPDSLIRFDPQAETFFTYTTPGLLAIYEDSQENFWLGSTQGLILFDRQSGTTRYYLSNPEDPTTLNSNAITVLFEDTNRNFWIGTFNGGLHKFDRQSNRFTRYLKDSQDPDSISSNTILTMYQAKDSSLWIGTSGGLNRFDPQSEKFSPFREKDGLPNDYVYGILEDDQGNLWMSTNKGLSRFDPSTLVFKNYDETDGLQSNEFNQWSAFRNREGVMYFGGIDGLNAFHPAQIQENTYLPPIALTNFEIYNQPVPVAPDSVLQQPIEASQEILLSHTDDFFQFEYAALHFSSPEEIEYAYQMEGLDKDWNMVGKQRSANYTNVPPGDYTFRVKGTNSDGIWNEQGVALKIIIPPPFWQTTWFRFLTAIAVIGGISGVFLLRIRSIEKQRQQLEAQVDTRTLELRQTMLALETARDAAEAANRAKSTFLANMSHELRTPLNAILGFTQVMARDKRLPPEHLENVAIVQRSSEHLLGLINDVLEVSKIEAGRTSLKLHNFDLHHLLAGLQEMFALRAENKGILLQMLLAPEVPHYVNGDEGKLRQVLMNLLGNAVKFTAQGQVVLHVQAPFPTQDQQARVSFAVEDTGPGISPQEIELLFLPFVQTSSGQQSQEGTGLGLSISQQYVQLMGGEIQVSSQPGGGSRFEFNIPFHVVSIADLEKPPLTRRVIGLEPGQPVYRLLVVDDQEVNRKLLIKIFQPLGFELRQAADGAEALQVWQTWNPHLIWMDMRMPVMDGYEATRRIKATTQGMATIIIALTASALEEDKQVILSEGCDDYMRKPFVENDLLEATAKHLGVRYIYEDVISTISTLGVADQAVESDGGSLLIITQLQTADSAWVSGLERATILGDLDEIDRLANLMQEQNPDLANMIASLADKFQHDQILALIERSRNPDKYAPD